VCFLRSLLIIVLSVKIINSVGKNTLINRSLKGYASVEEEKLRKEIWYVLDAYKIKTGRERENKINSKESLENVSLKNFYLNQRRSIKKIGFRNLFRKNKLG